MYTEHRKPTIAYRNQSTMDLYGKSEYRDYLHNTVAKQNLDLK